MIKNTRDLELDSRLNGLFKCHAIYSSRKNFNDPLDSKIVFIEPTAKELEELSNELFNQNQQASEEFNSYFFNGELSEKGKEFIEKYIKHLDSLFDEEYFFYCVSKNGTSNLMWSHYGDSHYGFCIEFKNKFCRKIDEVIYKNELPKLKMIDCLRYEFKSKGFQILANIDSNILWNSIRTKYDEWSYESEYRIHAWDEMIESCIEKNDKFIKIKYDPTLVESIIFGYRMEERIKKYIIENIPYKVKFKQSIFTDEGFKNVDYPVI
jgi:hypothetical protein